MIICGVIAFCIVEFRAKPDDDDDTDGEPFHGSTKHRDRLDDHPDDRRHGTGHLRLDRARPGRGQAAQRDDDQGRRPAVRLELRVPQLGVKTSGDLVVPVNRPLYFEMTSVDVIHSFYVPNARLKRDVADGFTTRLRFTPNKLGSYPIVCAELCGIGHATMRSTLRVVTPAEFTTWIARQKADPMPPSQPARTRSRRQTGAEPSGKLRV